jgi:parvulin-like peptidyl-prolyl isomerase
VRPGPRAPPCAIGPAGHRAEPVNAAGSHHVTFRAKPVVKRSHRPSWESQDRRNFYLNIGFGLVVLASIAILAIAAGATWYDQHWASVASVNGQSITKDDLQARYNVERFRIEIARRRVATELAAGRLTTAQSEQQTQFLDQREQQLPSIALQRLIDIRIQSDLARQEGVTVDDGAIDAKLAEEATIPEQRHVWAIEVEPEKSTGATKASAEQVAKARTKADNALKDLKAGKKWEDVAKTASTAANAAQGGDEGWLTADSTSFEKPFVDALFKLDANGLTDVIEGKDGTFRIGRVSEIAPKSTDDAYTAQLADFDVSTGAYREVVRADIVRQRLEDKVVADAIKPSAQRRVQEIFIAAPQEAPAEGAVKVRHILYSPNDDPNAASKLKGDDPAWEKAHQEALATYETLKKDITKFDSTARKDSDEGSAAQTGGKLPYYDPLSQIDEKFAFAIFQPGRQPGQLLEPVRSSFGWHVIQIMYFPPDLTEAKKLKQQADGGADFAQLARDFSDADTAADGGNLGWVARNQLEQANEDAIFGAKVGSVTDPVEVASTGIYLYKVLEEQVRAPEGGQLDTIKSTAFDNWYAAKKKAYNITQPTGAADTTPTQ